MIHEFTEIERAQAWFKKLKDSLEERLSEHRKRNDSAKLTADETAFLRGQITEVKALLSDMGEKPNPTIAPRRNPYN